MLKKIIILLSLVFALQANAGIRVYDPATGKSKSANMLMDADVLKSVDISNSGSMTEKQKQNLVEKDVKYRMRKIDAEMARIKEATKYGFVYVFVDAPTFSSKIAKVINTISEIEGIGKEYHLKSAKSPAAYAGMMIQLEENLKVEFSIDFGGKNARKFHVTRFPEMIYIDPNGVKSRYGVSNGSVTALKLRIKEFASIMKNYQ